MHRRSQFSSRIRGCYGHDPYIPVPNRITVILNGVRIHDNVEVTRATGGELDTNVNEPGPIMLQGDHGAIAFRNVRIKTLN